MLFGEGPQIKNIAGDLNKLFLQGSRVGQPITNVEGDAAADQGTVDLLAAMDPVIQEVAVGMSGEESRHYTVSGIPPLTLTDSLGKPLTSWSVDFSPYQEGTGDPSPSNVRPIHGTDKLNLFVEESYDQSATPKAVITLPQTVYTGTIGSEGGESRHNKIVLDGSPDENITLGGYGMTFKFTLPNDVKLTKTDSDLADDICNQMVQVKQASTWGINGTFSRTMNDRRVWFKIDDTITTLEDLSTYLASNPIEYVYELATPTTFAVPSVTIPTPTGTATTWATAEDGTVDSMEVTYVGKA